LCVKNHDSSVGIVLLCRRNQAISFHITCSCGSYNDRSVGVVRLCVRRPDRSFPIVFCVEGTTIVQSV
jgi:hypothetical protein